MMESPWQRLSLPKHDGLPLLLFKLNTTPKSYEIYITDLTQLWREQLSYKQVLKRAEQDDTTIDPSEGPGQFSVLLQKIYEALRNRPGGSMALTPGSGSEPDSLHLQLSMKLPEPLKQFRWNMYLSKRPYTESTNHLVLSLLREDMNSEVRQRILLEHLKQKDWVLSKLFDKVEAMGIDLSTIFPSTAGLRGARKETSLAQAAKYIKGVAPFNEREWLEDNQSTLGASLVKAISGDASDESGLDGLHAPPDKWWESIDASSNVEAAPEPEENREEPVLKGPEPTEQMDIDTASEDEDDEFERQETPPGLKQQKEPRAPAPEKTKSKQSPTKESESPPPKPQRSPSKGLGKIGRGAGDKPQTEARQPSPTPTPTPSPSPISKKLSSPPQPEPQLASASATASTASSPDLDRQPTPEFEPESKQPSPIHIVQDDQETDSGSDNEQQSAGELPASQPPEPNPPSKHHPKDESTKQKNKPRRGGLGVIGGKKKEKKATTPSSSPPPQQTESPEQPRPKPTPKKAGKLGVIGGKSKPKPTAQTEPDQDNTSKKDAKSSRKQPSPSGIGLRLKQAVREEDEEPESKQRLSADGVKKESVEPAQEETEDQRADMKREELKRQLEAKSKAPVKKRRKF